LWMTVILFLLSLALSLIASLVLARDLDKLGARLHLSEGLLGLVTALGADAPEISSAITALISGKHDLGLGVVLGSNLFNLAALLGLSAIIAGKVKIKRQGLMLNGVVALLVTVIIVVLLIGWIQPIVCAILLAVLFLPYIGLSALHPRNVSQLSFSGPVQRFLSLALSEASEDARKDQQAPEATWTDALSVIPSLVAIVLASVGMVNTAITLGVEWHVSHMIIGTFILATLTGIPNMLAAIRLALRGRGSAVVSEALNSNTFNLFSGIFLPIVILGLGTVSSSTQFALWWLLGLTLGVIALASFRGGLLRSDGAVVIALYLLFAVLLIVFIG
jgi:cation:H+ antiporter